MQPRTPEDWKARIERVLLDPALAPALAEVLLDDGEPPLTDAGLEDALRVMQEGHRADRLRELTAAVRRGEVGPGDPRGPELVALFREEC